MSRLHPACRGAFTLVELLVVIAIIGVLVALLLPAVQAARESARRTQCSNHLKQIGLGFQLHHDTFGACPTGGEGADPARTWSGGAPATGVAQRWNWAYQILPYIEQQNLYQNNDDNVVKGTPIKIYSCPTRRPPQVWDINHSGSVGLRAQIDYAACRGSHNEGRDGVVVRSATNVPVTRFETITDGLSNTLVASERCLSTDWYLRPAGPENDWFRGGYISGYVGNNNRAWLTLATTPFPPTKDFRTTGTTVSLTIMKSFGSAHASGIIGVLADGSVRNISYTINPVTWTDLGRRDDGNTLGDF
jgi:prepilin-type N-terminal cleavage/methylation domain-containing protein